MDKSYIVRVLSIGEIQSHVEGNFVIVDQLTIEGFTIKIYHTEKDSEFIFWMEKPLPPGGAWVEFTLPLPETKTAYLSHLIRWVTNKMLKTPIDL